MKQKKMMTIRTEAMLLSLRIRADADAADEVDVEELAAGAVEEATLKLQSRKPSPPPNLRAQTRKSEQ